MAFCIDARILGTEKHLLRTDTGLEWIEQVPDDVWHLSGERKSGSEWCLDTLLRLSAININTNPEQKFVASIVPFVSGTMYVDCVPWRYVLPTQTHRDFMKRLVNDIDVAMAKCQVKYYRDTWVNGDRIFGHLKRARINRQLWQSLIDARVGNVNSVATFCPDQYGYAEKVFYDRFGTLTGRLTVKSGPSIHTLKKEYRNIIEPSHPAGQILVLDFAALEARVLLYEAGHRCDEPDLYKMIADELGYARKAVKGAVISELYGSSKFALGKALNIEGKELNDFVKRIKIYFKTHQLLKRIKQQFATSGYIVNRFGRRIGVDVPMDHVFINYYAQSTGADVALLGFSKIAEQLTCDAKRSHPLFLLHDGMFVDVHPDDIEYIKSIKEVHVDGYVQKFFIKTELLV